MDNKCLQITTLGKVDNLNLPKIDELAISCISTKGSSETIPIRLYFGTSISGTKLTLDSDMTFCNSSGVSTGSNEAIIPTSGDRYIYFIPNKSSFFLKIRNKYNLSSLGTITGSVAFVYKNGSTGDLQLNFSDIKYLTNLTQIIDSQTQDRTTTFEGNLSDLIHLSLNGFRLTTINGNKYIYGNINVFKNMPLSTLWLKSNFNQLDLAINEGVTGLISELPVSLVSFYAMGCAISGDINSFLTARSLLTDLIIPNTDISGTTSFLLTKPTLFNSASIFGTKIVATLDHFSNVTSVSINLSGLKVTGDLAKINNNIGLVTFGSTNLIKNNLENEQSIDFGVVSSSRNKFLSILRARFSTDANLIKYLNAMNSTSITDFSSGRTSTIIYSGTVPSTITDIVTQLAAKNITITFLQA